MSVDSALTRAADFTAARRTGRRSATTYVAVASGIAAVALHVYLAVVQLHDAMIATLMLVLAAACLPCAIAAWRRCTGHSMTMLMVMSLGSAFANLATMLVLNSMPHAGHGMLSETTTGQLGAPSGHVTSMFGLIVLEVVTASAAAVCVRRFNRTA